MSRRVQLPALVAAPASAGVVDVLTGAAPLVPPVAPGPLSEQDARALTERIRQTARDVNDRVTRLLQLVEQALTGEAWSALGYASWTAYLADTLEPMRLPLEERREVVGWLTGRGMSTRAIAPIVSVDQKTISNDRRAIAAATAGEEDSSPAPLVVTGVDGKTYTTAPTRHLAVVPVVEAVPALGMPVADDERDAFLELLRARLGERGTLVAADWTALLAEVRAIEHRAQA
ncbi:hypothetical protein [Cellulomonas timonensis]|uniref:hypothetical protein n=1 Tax=Cellulomonas timonensis TaxID=1689271 RepID=UPI00082A6792|nr:hypothetical protein [Cellulomonas timonensis]